MKTVKFTSALTRLVLDGSKTATWRLFDDKDLSVDDKIELMNSDNKKVFAQAEITKVKEKKLKDIVDGDFDGHEKFLNPEEMLATYRKYYGEKVDWNTIVKMIDFKIISKT